MPDISKINALAIGSVSKVDGLAKASILDIDGVAIPAGVAPPLDTYTGAAAAYSVRLLRTAYTGDIMRVRRSSDNVEVDVGFDSNNEFGLTSPVSNASSGGPFTDFADFIGHGGTPADGYCRWWYDQSGNANDGGQAASTQQPQIYDAVTGIIEKGAPGKERPALQWFSTSNSLTTSGNVLNSNDLSLTFVGARDSLSPNYNMHTVSQFTGSSSTAIYGSGADQYLLLDGGVVASGSGGPGTAQHMYYFDTDGTNYEFRLNATAVYSGTRAYGTGTNVLSLGSYSGGLGFFGPIQEIILWSGAKSDTDRNGIEDNINAYFQIF